MTVLRHLYRDLRGVAAIEFAIVAPVLLSLLLGMMQIGIIFQSSAGLKFALDEAARLAIIYPQPTDDAITARFNAKRFGLDPAGLAVTVTHGTANGVGYADINAAYTTTLNFVFFTAPPITLQETRRAFQPS